MKKVFVGMSGGVDSSVAAALLKKQDYDVTGVYIKGYNIDGCYEGDVNDARKAAEVLGIPFYVFDMEKEYKDKVVKYMISGYKKGITPNPDVMCNKEIKFGLFLAKALKMGADYIATGHYVKLKNGKLYQAKDKNKDQSYFLWTLTQKQLKHCLFPVGDIVKPEVRKLAKKYKLPNAEKKDSQGVCFLGKIGMKGFLEKYIPPKKGIVVNTKGEIVGEHDGVQFYTIGQRHGLRLGKRNADNAKPYFVAEKDVKSNAILVAEGENNPALYKKEVEITDVNWISGKPKNGQRVMMRVRYRQPLFSAASKGNKIIFDKPQKFVAQGQSAVFYTKAEEMLGGGVII
ncbi:MAG: tRNA 2-thiouridine(34) synthase MnmA [Candidatus Pacebacteria bacterium]|nr:tRNA 2-thiouridine(34) synthase MnmA [Candidatus Paceibacterota bacterium]